MKAQSEFAGDHNSLTEMMWMLIRCNNNDICHEFGVCSDILYENAENENIEISYFSNGTWFQYQIQYSADDELLTLKEGNHVCPFKDNHLVYLSAHRIGPQKLYGITDESILARRDLLVLRTFS